jgi:hypothetical protein
VDLFTGLKSMAVCQELDKQDFNFQKHIFGKSFHTMSSEAIFVGRNEKN